MLSVIENDKALELTNRYFELLSKTGYVRDDTSRRFLVYVFLIDFIDCVYPFMTDEDYEKVDCLLTGLFSNGGCLLPYTTDCRHCAVVGLPDKYCTKFRAVAGLPIYTGTFTKRITEDEDDRITENGRMRAL